MDRYTKTQLLALLHDGEMGKAAFAELKRRGFTIAFRKSGGGYVAHARKMPSQKKAISLAIFFSCALVAAIIIFSYI